MEWFYFVIMHTPFWAVPLGMISLQFAYLYWVKEYRKTAVCFVAAASFCFCAVVFYYWAGGPEQTTFKLESIFSIIF